MLERLGTKTTRIPHFRAICRCSSTLVVLRVRADPVTPVALQSVVGYSQNPTAKGRCVGGWVGGGGGAVRLTDVVSAKVPAEAMIRKLPAVEPAV